MLETPTAIANADAIAAVPGIDSLLIGTNDLAMELGIPGGFGDERIVAAYQAVCDACREHGKHAGVGGISRRRAVAPLYPDGCARCLAGQRFQLSAGRRHRARHHNARLSLNVVHAGVTS